MRNFDLAQFPNQKGRIAIVTGANIGIGYETALSLAKKEATVILACRTKSKAEAARADILKVVPEARVEIILLDLSKLKSVQAFADEYLDRYDRLDLLINNAGVMVPPFSLTEDGFELQMGTNYFGHFLLTGLLLPRLLKTGNSRIVSLSSIAHQQGEVDFDDLQSKKKYKPIKAYAQSKLACLMFAYELQRRLDAAGQTQTISVAAHPGVSPTNLMQHIPKFLTFVLTPLFKPFTHPPEKGAHPSLLAALDPTVKGGDYYGPTGYREMKGEAGQVGSTPLSKDKAVAKRLWEVSEQLTDFSYAAILETANS